MYIINMTLIINKSRHKVDGVWLFWHGIYFRVHTFFNGPKGKIGGMALAGAALLFLAACYPPSIPNGVYRVYYEGNGHTEGNPPVDPLAYNTGDTAIIMEKPADLKRADKQFLGWSWQDYTSKTICLPGDQITIEHENVMLRALWEHGPVFEYITDTASGQVTITGYNKEAGPVNVIIPNTIEGKPVTCIASNAFYRQETPGLVLSEELLFIEDNAFGYASGFFVLDIPGKVREIGINAFQQCGIADLKLGAALETIGAFAFIDNFLDRLSLPQNCLVIGEGAFDMNYITYIEIGDNVDIQGDSSLGVYGAAFRAYYAEQGKAAGVYSYTGNMWR